MASTTTTTTTSSSSLSSASSQTATDNNTTTAPPPQQRIRSSIPTTNLDPTLYTWSTLFKCLMGNCTPLERENYMTLRDISREEADCARCDQWVSWQYAYSPTVRFLREQIQTVGPDLPKERVHCMRCPFDKKGGFHPDFGILLCANHLTTRKRHEDTLAHEMVHAYDHLRFKFEWTNLKHQACSEIRASMLSGECRLAEEWLHRKQMSVMGKEGLGQFQECVRRRAVWSVMGKPECGGDEEVATRVVKEVWGSCFGDTRPFDEVYR